MNDWIIFILLILGSLFVLISAIGLLRLPDLFMRMHATTKTTSLGLTMLLLAIVFAMPELSTIIKALLIIIFLYLTTPLGSQVLSKAGHNLDIKKWHEYERDDMKKK